jgi:hypothetical protein
MGKAKGSWSNPSEKTLEEVIGNRPFKVNVFAGPDRILRGPKQTNPLLIGFPSVGAIEEFDRCGFQYDQIILDIAADLGLSRREVLNIIFNSKNLPHQIPDSLGITDQNLRRVLVKSFSGRYSLDLRKMKKAFALAQMLHQDEFLQMALCHLEGPGKTYENLLSYVNHILFNKGKNPRLPKRSASTRRVENIEEVENVDFWFVKEGFFTKVLLVEVHLTSKTGEQSNVRLVINVPTDRTSAAASVRRAYLALSDHYLWEPRFVMEPLGLGTEEVPVLVGEWVENSDELHLYPQSGSGQFHLWQGQRIREDILLSEEDSTEIWKQIIRIQTMYSSISGDIPLVHRPYINRGDYVVYYHEENKPHVVLIWDDWEDPFNPWVSTDLTAIVMNALLFFEKENKNSVDHFIWLDQPDLTIEAVRDGFLWNRGDVKQANRLINKQFRLAYHDLLPEVIERSADKEQEKDLHGVATRAREAVDRYLITLKSGLDDLPADC